MEGIAIIINVAHLPVALVQLMMIKAVATVQIADAAKHVAPMTVVIVAIKNLI